jgi:hypothetical protein
MKETYSDLHGCNVNGVRETLVTIMAARKVPHADTGVLCGSLCYAFVSEYMRSEDLKAVVASINIFWDMMLCSLVGIYYCSGGTSCFRFEGRVLSQMWKQLGFPYPILPNFPIPHTSHQKALSSYFYILAKTAFSKVKGKKCFSFPLHRLAKGL